MPHLIIEYGGVVLPQETLAELHRTLLDSGLFAEDDIKIRLHPFSEGGCSVGGAAGQGFVHLELRLLEGRGQAQRTQLSRTLADTVARLLHGKADKLQISVELREMAQAAYTKIRL